MWGGRGQRRGCDIGNGALGELVELLQLGQLHVLVLLVGHLDVRLLEDGVGLLGRLVGPHLAKKPRTAARDRTDGSMCGRLI